MITFKLRINQLIDESVQKSNVTFMSKGLVPMRSSASVDQPIELLDGLT